MFEPKESEPLVGRRKEMARLAAAVEARLPLLIHGPAGAGKTFLVRRLLDTLPAAERRACVYISGFRSIHVLLESVVRQVLSPFSPVLESATSGRLRILLRDAVHERRLCILLDHAPPFSATLARLAREWQWRDASSVLLLARGKTRDEIGYAWSLYYTPELRLSIGRLPAHEAEELLDRSIRRFALPPLDSPEFRSGVLRLSGGLPGAIVKMCAMAAQPRYHYGRQVKLRLIHVDYLLQEVSGERAPATRAVR